MKVETREWKQAEVFCQDYFGTQMVTFDGVPIVDALAGYLTRVKMDDRAEAARGEQLELQFPHN